MKTTQQHNGANGRGGCGGLPLRERERAKEEREGEKRRETEANNKIKM
jgi:hypothetical protein